ncbi:MAG: kelch repeat-containing protein [Herbinix sp.]|nr:kelch repeat-containing protein [Herbinix sp.]
MSVDKLLASSLISSPEGELTKSVLSNIQQIKTFETGMYYMAGEKVYFNDANTSSIKICSKTHFADEYKKDHWQNYDETYNHLTQGSIEHSHNITTPVDDVFPMGKRAGYIVPMGEVYKPEPGDNIDFLNSMLTPNISSMAITSEKNLISVAIVDKDKKGFYINTLLHGTYILTYSNAVYKNALNTCVIKTTKLFWNGFNTLPTITPVINSDGDIEITLRGEKIYFSNTGWALTDDFMNATPILFSFYKKEDAKDVGLSSYNKPLNTYPTMILPNGLPTSIIKDKFYKINMKLQRLTFVYNQEVSSYCYSISPMSSDILNKIGNFHNQNHSFCMGITSPRFKNINSNLINTNKLSNNQTALRYNKNTGNLITIYKNNNRLSTVEVRNKSDGSFVTYFHRPVPSLYSTYTVIGNKIYMIGGNNGFANISDIYSYDTVNMVWETEAKMSSSMVYHTSIVHNNKIYIIGGKRAEIREFNPSTKTVTNKITDSRLLYTNVHTRSFLYNNKIYIITSNYNYMLIYDITNNTLSTSANFSIARTRFMCEINNGKIYIIGGDYSESGTPVYLNSVEIYDIVSNTWSLINLPNIKSGGCVKVYNNKLYIIGGSTNSNHILDISTNTFTAGPQFGNNITIKDAGPDSSLLINDKIYIYGGSNSSSSIVDMICIYDISNGTISYDSLTIASRINTALAVNDKIYIFLQKTDVTAPFYADVLLPDSIETKEFSDEFDSNYNSIGYLYNDNSSDTNLAISSLHPKDLTLPYNMTKAKSIVFKNELYNFLHKGPVTDVNVTKLDLIKNKWDSYGSIKTNQMDITPVNVKINGEETTAMVCNVSQYNQTDGGWSVDDSSGELVIDATIFGNGYQSKLGQNILPYPYAQTTRTHNGITFTDNNGIIIATGTQNGSGDSSQFWCCGPDNNYKFGPGTYRINGCASGGSISTYWFGVDFYIGSTFQGSVVRDYGSGATFTISSSDSATYNYKIFIFINKSYSITNSLTFTPQLTNGSVNLPYEPYTPDPTSEAPIMPVCLPAGTSISFIEKNYFNKNANAAFISGETSIEETATGIKVSGTNGTFKRVIYKVPLIKNTLYNISYNAAEISGDQTTKCAMVIVDGIYPIPSAALPQNLRSFAGIGLKSRTFTPTANFVWVVLFSSYNVNSTTSNSFDDIQIELGSTTTPYSHYTNPSTLVTPCDLWENDSFNPITGKAIQGDAVIESYNNEPIPSTYRSSTGNLTPQKQVANLVANGDFSNGTTGWIAKSSTLSSANNTLVVTGTGAVAYAGAQNTFGTKIANNKYFGKLRFRVTNAEAIRISAFCTSAAVDKQFSTVFNPVQNQWYDIAAIITPTTDIYDIRIYQYYADASSTTGKVLEVQYVVVEPTTNDFGAGNEPTAAEMDARLATSFVNSWFDGTATLKGSYVVYKLETPIETQYAPQSITPPKGIVNVIVEPPAATNAVLPSNMDLKYKNQIKTFKNNTFSLIDWVIPFNFEKATSVAHKEFVYVFPQMVGKLNNYYKLNLNKQTVEEFTYPSGFRIQFTNIGLTMSDNIIYLIGGKYIAAGIEYSSNFIRALDTKTMNIFSIVAYYPVMMNPTCYSIKNADGSIIIFALPETLDAIHCIDIANKVTTSVTLASVGLATRTNAASAMYGDNIIIMGGVSEVASYNENDIIIFNTKTKTLYNPNITINYPFDSEDEKKRRLKYLFGEVDSSKLMKASSGSSGVNEDVLDDINSSIDSLEKELKEQINTVATDSTTAINTLNTNLTAEMTAMETRINASTIAATRITGTIAEANLPKSALERLVNVANTAARFALTTTTVQLGDTVKENDTGNMYMVKDTTKLSSEAGYEPYTASVSSDSSKLGGKTPDKYVQRDINTDQTIGTGTQKLKINTAGAYPVVGIGDKNITANSEAVTIDKVATNKVILNDKIDIVYNSSLNAIEFNKR